MADFGTRNEAPGSKWSRAPPRQSLGEAAYDMLSAPLIRPLMLVAAAAVAMGACRSEAVPRGVEVSRQEAVQALRDHEDGHRIDHIEARLVRWRDFAAAQEQIDRAEGSPPEEDSGAADVEDSDFVWVVGAAGDFFDEHGERYSQSLVVVETVRGEIVLWSWGGGTTGSRVPRVLKLLDDRAS